VTHKQMQAYIRWHGKDRSIRQIAGHMGITTKQVRDIYDEVFNLPKSKFEPPKPDGLHAEIAQACHKKPFPTMDEVIRRLYAGVEPWRIARSFRCSLDIINDIISCYRSRYGTISLAASDTYDLLSNDWQSAKDMCASGSHRNTVYTHLREICEAGMCEKMKVGKTHFYRRKEKTNA